MNLIEIITYYIPLINFLVTNTCVLVTLYFSWSNAKKTKLEIQKVKLEIQKVTVDISKSENILVTASKDDIGIFAKQNKVAMSIIAIMLIFVPITSIYVAYINQSNLNVQLEKKSINISRITLDSIYISDLLPRHIEYADKRPNIHLFVKYDSSISYLKIDSIKSGNSNAYRKSRADEILYYIRTGEELSNKLDSIQLKKLFSKSYFGTISIEQDTSTSKLQ